MKDTLMTEEFGKKKNYKGIILILIAIILILAITYGIYSYMTNKQKEKKKKQEVEVTSLNNELQNLYGFAISDNYIVGLKKDKTTIKIYNLLQGTGNLGDFTSYTYYNDKLYLLFSDNSLYTISLTSGDKVYELTKSLSYEPIPCTTGVIGKTSDIAFSGTTIYLNTSSCGINKLAYDSKTKKMTSQVLKTFSEANVDMEYSKTDKALYIKGDHSIYRLDTTTKETTTIINNINSSIPLMIKSNILLFTNIENNSIVYYGYNIKTKEISKIAENISDLIIYDNAFLYRTTDGIYLLKGTKTTKIYPVHYNTLSNMQLIGENTLQVIDSDSNDDTKKRIINIDLTSKNYATIQNNAEFTNVVEYKND